MTKKHYDLIAGVLATARSDDAVGERAADRIALIFAEALVPTNPRFDRCRFLAATRSN